MSNYGEVRRSAPGKNTHVGLILKPDINRYGHAMVTFYIRGKPARFQVHHLVLKAFVGDRPKGLQCCHWNGQPADNFWLNLRWDTAQANSDDMRRHGVTVVASRILTEADVHMIRARHRDGERLREIAKSYPQVAEITVKKAMYGMTWAHLQDASKYPAEDRS